jgi:hypothetical protein
MTSSLRDDFAQKTKETIARRSGYRCAFPNCRRLTTMPNPEDPSSSVSTGIAAHICAASVGGPRYDTTMTPEERVSAANGIWLCAACSKIVDTLPDAFPVETLRYWKQNAEHTAARDAQLTAYDIDGLIADIDRLYHAMISFVQEWDNSTFVVDWEPGWQNRLSAHSEQRKHAYLAKIHPQLIIILDRISVALGRPSLATDLRNHVIGAQTNDIGIVFMAEQLLLLRSQLLYR